MKTAKDLQRVEDKRRLKQLMYEEPAAFPALGDELHL